jgi:hypothetical protein
MPCGAPIRLRGGGLRIKRGRANRAQSERQGRRNREVHCSRTSRVSGPWRSGGNLPGARRIVQGVHGRERPGSVAWKRVSVDDRVGRCLVPKSLDDGGLFSRTRSGGRRALPRSNPESVRLRGRMETSRDRRFEMTERWRSKQHVRANRSKIDKAFFKPLAKLRTSGGPQ